MHFGQHFGSSAPLVPLDVELNVVLEDAGISATGIVEVAGVLEVTLDTVALLSVGQVELQGSVNATLGSVTMTFVGKVESPNLAQVPIIRRARFATLRPIIRLGQVR